MKRELAKDKAKYWVCPYGCGEWWPDQEKLKERLRLNRNTKFAGRKHYPDPLPAGPIDPKKHQSRSGRKRKKPPKKNNQNTWELE